MEQPILNEHNKSENPPMHSAEHLLNGEMARRYKCGRAFTGHVERKKSKLDYHLPQALTDEELRSLECYVNGAVAADVVSSLLWAANGFNREDKRTAPSAINAQDIDIYVCFEFGIYLSAGL